MLQFTHLVNLQVLQITHFTPLSDRQLISVALNCPQITHINISGKLQCYAYFLYLRHIVWTYSLEYFKQIISLVLVIGCYNLSDAGLTAITTLPKLAYLYINLLSNITDLGLENIANLKEFECYTCPLITDDGICKVLASSPQLQILNLSKCCSITNATYDVAKQICDSRTSNIILKMFIWGTQIVLTDEHKVSPFLQTVNVNMAYTGCRWADASELGRRKRR